MHKPQKGEKRKQQIYSGETQQTLLFQVIKMGKLKCSRILSCFFKFYSQSVIADCF